ncbi:putative mRNA-splicing protein ubp10 [Fusarium oxysporum f. sp. albedinis]|nr:putative mRNA-splicing protein ubp10 [Fusarium oxysporum f. sp. albedinis]
MRCTTAAASAGITRDMSQIWVSGSFVSALFAPSAIPSSWQTSSFPYLTLSLCFHLHRHFFSSLKPLPRSILFRIMPGLGKHQLYITRRQDWPSILTGKIPWKNSSHVT